MITVTAAVSSHATGHTVSLLSITSLILKMTDMRIESSVVMQCVTWRHVDHVIDHIMTSETINGCLSTIRSWHNIAYRRNRRETKTIVARCRSSRRGHTVHRRGHRGHRRGHTG